MKKTLIIIFMVIVILVTLGIIYLNKVYLPIKIKSLLIKGIEEQTHKRVNLESLQFHLFKGLVLKNLAIFDGQKTILEVKETSVAFLILPFFKKQVIIPVLRIQSPVLFLERRADHTLNILDLLPKKVQKNKKFNLLIYKISVSAGRIDFKDNTFSPTLSKTLEHLNLVLQLALPNSVRFNLKSELVAELPIKITSLGEYNLAQQQLKAKILVKDFSPQELMPYYQNFAISIPEGLIDAKIDLGFKENVLNATLNAQGKDLKVTKDKLSLKLNSDTEMWLKYNLKDKQLNYKGRAKISDTNILGLEFVDSVEAISGEVNFDNSGLSSDRLNATLLGIPVQFKAGLTNFPQPLLNLNLNAGLSLNSIPGILEEKFRFSLPVALQGNGQLSLNLQTKLPLSQRPQINGYLDIINTTLQPKNLNFSLEKINGRLEFTANELRWQNLSFKYFDIDYKTSGVLTNFQVPDVQLQLSSKDLSLQSLFAVSGKLIKLSQFSGRYLNSDFSLNGNIDLADLRHIQTEIDGGLDLDLGDIKSPLQKFKDRLEKMRPAGKAQIKFNLAGNINDWKSCVISANVSSPNISVYGLKSDEVSLDYTQANRLAEIPSLHLSFYGGTIAASAKMNLNTENLPLWINADLENVKLENLKLATPLKDEDIAGTIQASIKINGFSNDLSGLSGAGQMMITNGKLWQLNLFKGLGSLLFTKDFTNIVFSEGSCGFLIQDKQIFTDNLNLKSNLIDITGSTRIGFDSSIEAVLNVQVTDAAPLSGTFKDVTTAILGQAGRFGVIRISGTLKEPKYKFTPAVVDVLKSLKDIFLGK